MRSNCLRHFAATLGILEPTVLILQGKGLQNWIAPVVTYRRTILPELSEGTTPGGRCLICQFSHPSAHPPHRWGANLDSDYLRNVVEPTLRCAAKELRRLKR